MLKKPYHLVFGRRLLPSPNGTVVRGEVISLPLDQHTHIYIKGMTGVGKTTLLSEMAASRIWQGAGVGIIEPGDLAQQTLILLVATGFFEKFPEAFKRFIYLDIRTAEKNEVYPPLNMLCGRDSQHTRADIMLKSYKHAWPAMLDGTSTNIELLVRMGALVLASNDLPLLPYLEYLYTDTEFQRRLLANTDDAAVQQWFKALKLQPKGGYIPEIALTTLKRTYALSFHPVGRYALSQQYNVLDINDILEKRQSFAVNLRLADDEVAKQLGCLITVQAETVAKSRDVVSAEEQDYSLALIIDEVQRYVEKAGQLFPTMFAESRKAKISLIVANQYDEQLPEELHGALSQCNTIIAFKSKSNTATNAVEQIDFPYNPHWVKQKTGNPLSLEGTRQQYYSGQEQKDIYAGWIKDLDPYQAFIRLPDNTIQKMETIAPEKPLSKQEAKELARRVEEVEQEYLRLYFRPKEAIDREIEETLARFGASQTNASDDRLSKSQVQESEPNSPSQPAPRIWRDSPIPKRPPMTKPKKVGTQVKEKPQSKVQEATPIPVIQPIVWDDDEVMFDNSDLNIPEDDDE
jgi:hypothetical protein